MTDTSDNAVRSSNEDNDNLVAELEAAAISWMLNKTKYTLECLRDARSAVLTRMQPPTHETLPVERSAVSDARLQTMIDKTSGRDRHAALLELQRWRRAHELKAKVVPSICGKPMPDGKGAGQCINPPGHEGDCDDMPF